MKHPLSELVSDRVSKLSVGRVFRYVFEHQDVRDKIVQLQKEQLGRGDDSKGGQFRDYSLVSLDVYNKPTKSPFFDPSGGDSIRLYDSGRFYQSIFVRAMSEEIAIITGISQFPGDDGSEVDLTAIVGPDILGLAPESMQELKKFILPITRETTLKILNGQIL